MKPAVPVMRIFVVWWVMVFLDYTDLGGLHGLFKDYTDFGVFWDSPFGEPVPHFLREGRGEVVCLASKFVFSAFSFPIVISKALNTLNISFFTC